MMLLANIVSKV